MDWFHFSLLEQLIVESLYIGRLKLWRLLVYQPCLCLRFIRLLRRNCCPFLHSGSALDHHPIFFDRC